MFTLLAYVKKLTVVNGWKYVIASVLKVSIYRFLLIVFFIFAAKILSRNRSILLPNKIPNKTFSSRDKYWIVILLPAVIFVLLQPTFRILYLFGKYGVEGHFYAYNHIVSHLLEGSKNIYLVDFLSSIIGIVLILCILKRSNVFSFKDLLFKNIPYLKNILFSILFVINAYFALNLLWMIIFRFFSCEMSIQQILFSFSKKNGIYAFAYIGLLTPLVQEIFFRGIFLQTLLEKIRPLYALILNSLMFSLYYSGIDFSQFIFFFAYGIILGLMYKKLGLFSCFILHSSLIVYKLV